MLQPQMLSCAWFVSRYFHASLSRPGGNATGRANMLHAISAKLVELLREAFPGARRVAILWNPENEAKKLEFEESFAAAKALGMHVRSVEVRTPHELNEGFAAIARDAARRYYEFAAMLAPLGMRIAAIDVSDRRSWAVEVTGIDGAATRLELGRDTDGIALNDRLAQVVAAYPMVAARVGGAPQSIDARYPNGLAALPPAKTR